tara:strand:+ start:536 stop:850 length:315 start_codon:yes stop_codon:yes gene_type:complete
MKHIWKIYNLERIKADGFVTDVTYACESSDNNISTRLIGDLTLSGSTEEPGFVPYENLTESEVLGWVNASIDEAAVETANSASIAAMAIARAAITSSNGIPWLE